MGVGLVRNEVLGFSLMMEKVLQRNDFKGGWRNMSTSEIMDRVYDEVRELNVARKTLDKSIGNVIMGKADHSIQEQEDVKRKAINVANFCMMLVDVLDKSLCETCGGSGEVGGIPDYACRGRGRRNTL